MSREKHARENLADIVQPEGGFDRLRQAIKKKERTARVIRTLLMIAGVVFLLWMIDSI